MKNYNKFITELLKDKNYEVIKTSKRKNTVKVLNKFLDEYYLIHPGDNAIQPIKNWIKRINKIK
jgi:hypothetical protein